MSAAADPTKWLSRHMIVHRGEIIHFDVLIDWEQLRRQAIKASESKAGAARDGALIVRITKPTA